MSARRSLTAFLSPLAIAALAGCQWVPKGQYEVAETRNRALVAQNRAQLAEIGNPRTHSRYI